MKVDAAMRISCLDEKPTVKALNNYLLTTSYLNCCQAKFRKRKNRNSLKNLHSTLKNLTRSTLLKVQVTIDIIFVDLYSTYCKL